MKGFFDSLRNTYNRYPKNIQRFYFGTLFFVILGTPIIFTILDYTYFPYIGKEMVKITDERKDKVIYTLFSPLHVIFYIIRYFQEHKDYIFQFTAVFENQTQLKLIYPKRISFTMKWWIH